MWRVAIAWMLRLDDYAERDCSLSCLLGAHNVIEASLPAIMHVPQPARSPNGEINRAARPGVERINRRIGRFVDARADRDSIVGDHFPVADLMLTSPRFLAGHMNFLSSHPTLTRFLTAILHAAKAAEYKNAL